MRTPIKGSTHETSADGQTDRQTDRQIDLTVCYIHSVMQTSKQTIRADLLDAVYFRLGLTCTLGLTNDLIDGGQPRAKTRLRKVKPNHGRLKLFLALGWPPSIKSWVNPRLCIRPSKIDCI